MQGVSNGAVTFTRSSDPDRYGPVYTYAPVYTSRPANSVSQGQQGSTDEQGNQLAFTIPSEQRLMRFLILGSEGGTFYSTEQELREQNATCIQQLIDSGQGEMVVEQVVSVAKKGRAIRMNSLLLTLAMCCRCNDIKTKNKAYHAIQEVCTIPTHLFKLIGYLESHGKTTGWGRGLRKAVCQWYNQFMHDPQRLAMLITKYRQRDGWSHRDLLRLCHLKPTNTTLGYVLRYAVRGLKEAQDFYIEDGKADMKDHRLKQIITYLNAVEEVRSLELQPAPKEEKAGNGDEMEVESGDLAEGAEPKVVAMDVPAEEKQRPEQEVAKITKCNELIRKFDLLREHLPTSMLNETSVWESLLQKMPMMALIRNLSKITHLDLLSKQENCDKICSRISNPEAITGAKIHPYLVFQAWQTYKRGRGVKGKLRWTPEPAILTALETAFYAAFGNVPSSGKRILIALDISGSMSWDPCNRHDGITPKLASAAMSMVTMAAETTVDVVSFSGELHVLDIKKGMKLDDVVNKVYSMPVGSTDCSLPMLWALDNKKEYDAFIVYTDCETWFSRMRPAEALKKYREEMKIPKARLAVVGMTSGGFTLADPNDLCMLDVVGFDSETPTALEAFISGSLCE